jgi:hypothetical protein
MDLVTSAVMVLLSCNAGAPSVCKPIDMAPTIFSSLDECHLALADRLTGAPDGEMVGRCRSVDPSATASLPAGYRTVVVTRGKGADAVSSQYIVLHKD